MGGSFFGKSSCMKESVNAQNCLFTRLTNHFEDDFDGQATAGAYCNIFSISQILNVNLKSIAARTRIMVYFE